MLGRRDNGAESTKRTKHYRTNVFFEKKNLPWLFIKIRQGWPKMKSSK